MDSLGSRRNQRRIKDATQFVERQPRNKVPGTLYPIGSPMWGAVGFTTTAISAASGSTPGGGSVRIVLGTPSTSLDSTTGMVVTVYNVAGAIASGVLVILIFANGSWWVAVAPCPS